MIKDNLDLTKLIQTFMYARSFSAVAMKVELEFETEMKDGSEVLAKLSQLAKSAKDLGFNLQEVELETEDDEGLEEKE